METLKVLATDDEPGMLLAVQRVLRGPALHVPEVSRDVAFEVATAATGEEALAQIEAAPPDILLLDYKLPGLSGLDVLERVASRRDDLLTIMMTAYASLETAVTATKCGAFDFLAKPFTPEELRATLRKAAGHLLMTKQARAFERERRQLRFQFISVLAHELKAPLGAVEGYLRIYKDRSAGDDPAVYERMIDRSLLRLQGMRKLIFDLLDLTRIESGQKQRDLQDVHLDELARTTLENFASEAAERRITLALHADTPVVHRADPGEMEIIFNNLVSNAIKYNRDGGRVDVTLLPDGPPPPDAPEGQAPPPACTLRVADTGIGMTPAETARLFQDFVRIKNPKTRSILGSGLGLSTLKKLALLYHGDVTVQSTPDQGSTFTVVLRDTHEIPPSNEPV